VQAMAEMQNKFAEQTRKFATLNPLSSLNSINSLSGGVGMPGLAGLNPAFSPEAWSKLMQGQNPMMQGLMNSYVEHSKTLFSQMQEQMQQQAAAMMGAAKTPTKR
jgi:hypothetical protein